MTGVQTCALPISTQELSGQTVYTLESLHERLSRSKRPASGQRPKAGCGPPGALPGRTEAGQEQLSADVLAERARELRGSPWQVCTGEEEEEEEEEGKRRLGHGGIGLGSPYTPVLGV